MSRWGVIAGVAVLTAGGAMLRAVFLRYPYIDSDQAVIGLMGMHILRGEFPIYFWGEPYSGTLESFVAALAFFVFGVSRLTLDLVPFLFSLLFLLLTWRLGLAVFDRPVGFLGLALAAFPPMLLTWHSVLARGNYIENLVLGNLLFLLTLKLARPDLGPPSHCRALLVYGFVFGFAWYMSFQSIHYLIASALFLLWRGRRRFLLRQSWVGCLGALLGSLPFWIYNLTSGFSSFGAIRWYAKGASFMDALWLLTKWKLPVLLGASGFVYNFESLVTQQLPSLQWPILGLYAASFLLALGMVVRKRIASSPDASRGGELLLVLPLVVAAVTAVGGFGAGRDARYILPMYTSAPLLLGASVRTLAGRSRPLAALMLGVVLVSNLYGNLTTAEGLPRYKMHLDNDRALFSYMKAHDLKYAFAPEYWFSYRFTFDAEESIIFATPFWQDYPRLLSKYPAYTRLVNRAAAPSAYVLWSIAGPIEKTLQAAGIQYEKVVIGRLTILHHFKPPSSGRSLPPRGWRLVGSNGREAFDRDPTTRWRGEANDSLTIDLGGISRFHHIALHLGEESLRARHGLQILVSTNGSAWSAVTSTVPLIAGFAWMGDRLLLDEHGRVGLRFPPVVARYLKIQLAPDSRSGPWAVDELFVAAEGDDAPLPPSFWDTLEAEEESGTRALLESLKLIRAAPDSEIAHILFRIALLNSNLPLDWVAIEEYAAARLAQEGRWKEAIPLYRHLAELQPFRSRYWQGLQAAYTALGALQEANAVEAEASPRFTPVVSSGVRFGQSLKLLGHEVKPVEVLQGAGVHLTLIWEVLRSPREAYAIFVHLTKDGRRVLAQDHYPLNGAAPTSQWERGERVRDEAQITIPPDLAPGRYQINLGVWDPLRRAQLRIWHGWLPTRKKSLPVGEITVVPAKTGG